MKEIHNLIELSRHINVPLPLDEDFNVMRIEDYYNTFSQAPMAPFRHRLYAISLYETINVELAVGFWRVHPQAPFRMFKSPCQVVSWAVQDGIVKGWFVMFTEKFILRHKQLVNLIQDFPFLQLDKAIPFNVQPADVDWLSATYRKILEEYHSAIPDRFELIAAYLQTLLLQVRRLYERERIAEPALTEASHQHDQALIGRFRTLVNDHITHQEDDGKRSVLHYAKQLFVHPNHLNAVAKRVTGTTALGIVHEQVVHTAKTLLLQTGLSVKEIAFQLAFKESTHFVTFFKKYTGFTPMQFREKHAA